MLKQNTLTRRQWLSFGVAGIAATLLPTRSEGATLDVLTQLDPARLLSGLVFDNIKAVTIKPIADKVVDLLVSGKAFAELKNQLTFCNLSGCKANPLDTKRHDNRKGALIVLGAADAYHAYRERERQHQLEIVLQDAAKLQRFEALLKYFVDERIKVQLAGMQWAEVLPANTTVDRLFTLEYCDRGAQQKQQIAQMIERTGVTVFDHWVV